MDTESQEVQNQFRKLIVPHWRDLLKEHWGEFFSLLQIERLLKKWFGESVDRQMINRCRNIAFEYFNYNIPYRTEEPI